MAKIRLIVQIFFFALIALIAVNQALEEAGKAIPILSSASLHAICPFGGVVSVYQFITVWSVTWAFLIVISYWFEPNKRCALISMKSSPRISK